MKSDATLQELLRISRCWGDEPPEELARRIDEERKRITPPSELMKTLAALRQEWAIAAVSQKRNRHIFFLGSVYQHVCEWRRLKRQNDLTVGLREHFEAGHGRDVFQALLFVVCAGQNRKVRHRWAACLRAVDRHRTPAELGAAQIIRLGGINQSAARQKKRRV